MEKGARRDRKIAAAIAIGTSLLVLMIKPLSLMSGICAVLFAVGAFPTVANVLSRFRGEEPSVPITAGEEGVHERGSIGAILGPASFTAIVSLMWLAT
jgi:hypothetical protein